MAPYNKYIAYVSKKCLTVELKISSKNLFDIEISNLFTLFISGLAITLTQLYAVKGVCFLKSSLNGEGGNNLISLDFFSFFIFHSDFTVIQ